MDSSLWQEKMVSRLSEPPEKACLSRGDFGKFRFLFQICRVSKWNLTP
jgi:hypothetical protein